MMKLIKTYPIFHPATLCKLVLVCTLCIMISVDLSAQVSENGVEEKSVDYLEHIYFSGENKEGLNLKILIAIQDIQKKVPSEGLAKQLTYLINIQDNAVAAEDACEVLDLLSVGIYNIDAAEAMAQGVHRPSAKANKKAGDAVGSLNKLSSTSGDLNRSARGVQWNSYLYNRGKSGSVASGAGKVANTAGQVSVVTNTASETVETARSVGELGKSLGIEIKKKDKPCKKVKKKEIEIEERVDLDSVSQDEESNEDTTERTVPNTGSMTSKISIEGVSASLLRQLTDEIKEKSGVNSASRAYSADLSTVSIKHSGKTDALADWIIDNYENKFELISYGSGTIKLRAK